MRGAGQPTGIIIVAGFARAIADGKDVNDVWADLAPPLRTSASRASPVQVLIVGQTSSNRSKTTPISSENVKPIAVH
jgi:hypothetical protein